MGCNRHSHAEKYFPYYFPPVGHLRFNHNVYSAYHTLNLHHTMNIEVKNEILTVCEVGISYRPKVKPSERPSLCSSQEIFRLLTGNQVFNPDTIEHREFFKVLLLNKSNRLLGVMHHSEGSMDGTVVDVRHIMQAAILANAAGLILCHNHPSGNCIPSAQDNKITQQIKQACALFSIHILDHLIISPYTYYSYADEGQIV
jgi:DNA repair protein RadC